MSRPAFFRPAAGRALVVAGLLSCFVSALCFTTHVRNNSYLMTATAFIFDAPGDEEGKVKALVHFVAVQGEQPVKPEGAGFVARLEHRLPLEISPVTVLKYGFAFPGAARFGPCGQLSRTIRAVAWLRHIRSHKVLMGSGAREHAMVALYVDGAYRLFDPTYDFHWTNRRGRVASVEEVRGDPRIFAQIYRRFPNYPYSLEDASYFRWSRLGWPGAWARAAMTWVMGREWVDELDTPKLYERPWWGYGWVSLLAGVACALYGRLLVRTR